MRKSDLSYRSKAYISLLRGLLWNFLQAFFRIEISGLENVPQGASMLIANHNSGALIESHGLLFALLSHGHTVYGLNHPSLFKIPFINMHFRKIGAVTASREVSKEVLANNATLLIFPGGNRQAFRPWSNRHDHDFPWAKGWAEIAVDTKVPVVPVKFIGTHNLNPILVSSEWVAKLLILPYLLGVKVFPVSVSQIVLSMGMALLGMALGLPPYVTAGCSYIIFLATSLFPILPARVQIQIYPAFQAQNKSAAQVQEIMSQIMRKQDYPKGRRREYALNGLERFMLQHETSELHYYSHFVFEFDGQVDKDKFLSTTEKWLQEIPHMRSVVLKGLWRSQRYVYDRAWFSSEDLVTFSQSTTPEQIDLFCQKKFNLHRDPLVRFLVSQGPLKTTVVFSCHHSLFDGAAHAFAFEEWSRIYNIGQSSGKYSELNSFRYKAVQKSFGWKQTVLLFFENFKFSPPRLKLNVASLMTNADLSSRKVNARVLKLADTSKMRDDFYSIALKSIDKTLRQTGDEQNPIITFMPIGLRFIMRLKNTLQNAVISHTFFIQRDTFIKGNLESKLKARLKADPLQTNSKFLFGVLPLCSFAKESALKKKFAELDHAKSAITATALLVSAPIPKGFVTPLDWKNLYISARGTLLKSPAVGFIFTGKPGFETITLEYLKDVVSEDRVNLMMTNLQREIGQTTAVEQNPQHGEALA